MNPIPSVTIEAAKSALVKIVAISHRKLAISRSTQSADAQSWWGRLLVSYEVIVTLVAATTKLVGLTICIDIDETEFGAVIKVTNDQLDALSIKQTRFIGERHGIFVSHHQLDKLIWRDATALFIGQRNRNCCNENQKDQN